VLDFVSGDVKAIVGDAAVIAVGGVGIRVEMTTPDLARLEGHVTVHTVLHVREDDIHLYGFTTTHARELFTALTSVSGVGPKLALAVLSVHSPDALERAIASDDTDALSLVSGVGKKTAGRIVLELRDRFGMVEKIVTAPTSSPLGEVREALKGMGFGIDEISNVLATLPDDGDTPTLLRHALKTIGSREPAGAAPPVN
jgi:holliday junction DNA helicase RuvA